MMKLKATMHFTFGIWIMVGLLMKWPLLLEKEEEEKQHTRTHIHVSVFLYMLY